MPNLKSDRGHTGQDNRLFLEAALWIVRTGSPCRDLPIELGNWHTTYTRFKRWGEAGVRIQPLKNGSCSSRTGDISFLYAGHSDKLTVS